MIYAYTKAQISGERLQDQWSSGCYIELISSNIPSSVSDVVGQASQINEEVVRFGILQQFWQFSLNGLHLKK